MGNYFYITSTRNCRMFVFPRTGYSFGIFYRDRSLHAGRFEYLVYVCKQLGRVLTHPL